ncbi:TonB-dependent receptor [Algoriphagus sp. CAU 1675]|uniref:TonB-dependent receptor domain-containing protein n=1 Tax=Algoriphagus sp. CAU 1675 TaxID=3032597 RepID=UPI0023DB917D|nr:TonB-dependent receptor [Algoriphagus sp. CAU 1675]MDF2158264.1 TonB-dependent receptor [Algoriphagus sp. CAU 1675]
MNLLQKYISKTVLVFALMLFASLKASAQKTIILQFLDSNSANPIIGLTYHYGPKDGITDQDGKISLEYVAETSLYLSHISYGSWSLNPDEILQASKIGKVYRKESIYGLQPVSVISLKLAQEKDQTIGISEQERLHHDAGEVLSLDPSVSGIRKGGSFAFDPVFRGYKYDQLNVVIDGLQSANAACPNRMDPPTSQVALNRIQKVEILKGPHALRYGIGLGGTLNYLQENPAFSSESGIYGRISSMFEQNGKVTRNEARIGFQGSKYDVGMLGSFAKGNDYKDGNGNFVPSEFLRGTAGLYADFKTSDKDLFQVSVNRNFARDVDFASLAMDLQSDDTWMSSLRHSRTFSSGSLSSWKTSAYFTRVDHLMDNLSRDLNPRMMNASVPVITENWGARTEGEWKFDKARLFAGADLKTETADGFRTREILMGPMAGKIFKDNIWQNSQIRKTGAFANYIFPANNYVLSFSGRLDINQAIAKNPADEFLPTTEDTESTQLNPGISIGAQRDLGKSLSLGIWAASVKRSGSLAERYINFLPIGLDPYEMLGNPNLKPETNNELDLVFGLQKEKFSLGLTLFGSYLTNYITAEKTDLAPRINTSPGVRQFTNLEEAFKTGFEFSFSHQMAEHISQNLNVAYTYAKDLELNAPLPEIAPMDLRYSLQGNFIQNKLQTRLSLRHVLAQNRISETFSELKTPEFTLLDWDASYAISNQIQVKGGVQNLLDQAFYEHLSRPIGINKIPLYSPGRNVFLMVSIKFP